MKKTFLFLFITAVIPMMAACSVSVILTPDEEIQKAVKENDPSICAKIEDEDQGKTQKRRDRCYEEIAIEYNNPMNCMEIQDQARQDNCDKAIAITNKEPDLCEVIDDVWKKNDCFMQVAEVKEDPLICGKIDDNNRNKSMCYSKVAVARKNQEICGNIDKESEKLGCIADVASVKEDLELCETLKEYDSTYYSCTSAIASKQNNPDLCNNLAVTKSRNYKNACFEDTAIMAKDYKTCELIEDTDDRDSCLSKIGRNNKIPEACEKITDEKRKEICSRLAK